MTLVEVTSPHRRTGGGRITDRTLPVDFFPTASARRICTWKPEYISLYLSCLLLDFTSSHLDGADLSLSELYFLQVIVEHLFPNVSVHRRALTGGPEEHTPLSCPPSNTPVPPPL